VPRLRAGEHDRGVDDLVSDPGARDLYVDGLTRDLKQDLGIRDLVQDHGIEEATKLGAFSGAARPVDLDLAISSAKSAGFALTLRPSGSLRSR
jgi:hypothetical protein